MPEEQNTSSGEEDSKIPKANEIHSPIQPVETVQQTEPGNTQSLTENMEVHHHPDLTHKKKNLKEYFLEFLMIFLAVTLGFFAENFRENIGDNEKEKDYINSFIKNLQDDISDLQNSISENQGKLQTMEKLMLLSSKNISDPVNRLSFYTYCTGPSSIGLYSAFISNDATMLQLKNSGGLRLIRKHHVADSIAKYDNGVKVLYSAENIYADASNLAMLATQEVLDYTVFYDTSYYRNGQFTNKFIPLLSDDKTKMKGFFNKINYAVGATQNYINNMHQRLTYAKRLVEFLKKEYGIE